MKQNPAVGRILHDRVETLANLVDRLVQQHLLHAVFLERGDGRVAARCRVFELRARRRVEHLVGGPLAPLHAVHVAEVVRALPVRIGEPLSVFVCVSVPDLAAERAEIGGTARRAQKADQFADCRFERELFRRHGGEALLQIEAQHRPRHADRADAGAVFLPAAGIEDRADEVEVLFHAGSFGRTLGAPDHFWENPDSSKPGERT
jgi:hypothetical protein